MNCYGKLYEGHLANRWQDIDLVDPQRRNSWLNGVDVAMLTAVCFNCPINLTCRRPRSARLNENIALTFSRVDTARLLA